MGGRSPLSPPFLHTQLPRSSFQNLALQASAAPRKSRDGPPVLLWGADFMSRGFLPRPSSFSQNLPLLFFSCAFVVFFPSSIISAKSWGGEAPWPPSVMRSAPTNRASRGRAAGERRVWRLSAQSRFPRFARFARKVARDLVRGQRFESPR